MAVLTSMVTVPVFGFGIKPRGPKILPSCPTLPIISGVAIKASKSSQPPLILATMSSPPTISAPASSASLILSPCAMTTTFFSFPPKPFGKTTVPRTNWSAFRGSTPNHIVNSIVSSNFAKAIDLTVAMPSSSVYFLRGSYFSRAAK